MNKEMKRHFAKLGRKGGKARLQKLTAEQRREIARNAGIASGKSRRKGKG